MKYNQYSISFVICNKMSNLAKPKRPYFSSGPCVKRPGWSLNALQNALVSRSHRAAVSLKRIQEVISKTKSILKIPNDFHVGIVPGSDTGAVEIALWNLLGPKGVDVFGWEAFSNGWISDVVEELKIEDVRTFKAEYGNIPDLTKADFTRDIVFTWNGTTSGVCVPNANWISANREGLTICDATSAVFAMDIDWSKIDVLTFSWQKCMGGEAAHGVLIMSPRAVQRLESHPPKRAMPKLFNIMKGDKVNLSIFDGSTINTPSMLCVEDALDSLKWIESIGGVDACIAQGKQKLDLFKAWIKKSGKYALLAKSDDIASTTSVCLKIDTEFYNALDSKKQGEFAKAVASYLEANEIALDAASYRDAPAGIRIWCGATVEASDIELLLPWLDIAYDEAVKKLSN